ncbi:hypothetical protein D918_08098 [Trichuris suis]|nr:hypothetical protein D918_08098 [Trichuris suis]
MQWKQAYFATFGSITRQMAPLSMRRNIVSDGRSIEFGSAVDCASLVSQTWSVIREADRLIGLPVTGQRE